MLCMLDKSMQACFRRLHGYAAAPERCVVPDLPDAHVHWHAQIRGIFAHGITLSACTNVTVANLTMHNVGMFFVIDWAGHGNQVSPAFHTC